jgi:structural maintenance of chromosome 1
LDGWLTEYFFSILPSGSSTYKVNNEQLSLPQYTAELAKENILVKAKNFLVFQGDVEQVASQSSKDLCTVIERISGSIQYAEEYENLQSASHESQKKAEGILAKKKNAISDIKVYRQQKEEEDAYNRKKDSVERHEKSVLLWELYHLESKAEEKAKELKACQEEVDEKMGNVDQGKRELKVVEQQYASFQREVQKLKKKLQTKDSEVEAAKVSLYPVKTKIDVTKKSRARFEEALKGVKNTRDDQTKHVEKVEKDIKNTEKALTKFDEKMEERKKSEMNISDADLEEFEGLKVQYTQRTSNEQSKIGNIVRSQRAAQDDAKNLSRSKESLAMKAGNLESELSSLTAQVKQMSLDVNELNTRLQNKKDELEQVVDDQKKRDEERKTHNSRLEDVLKKLESVQADERETEKERRMREMMKKLKQQVPAVRGYVYELFYPPQDKHSKYAKSIDTVLGKHHDSVVVDSYKDCQDCIEYLKANRMGVLKFIPLDNISTNPIDSSLKSVLPGARLAVDVIQCDPALRSAAEFICSDTMICDNLEVAKQLRWQKNVHVRAVTLEGFVISRGNTMSGGNDGSKPAPAHDVRKWKLMKEQELSILQGLNSNVHEQIAKEEQLKGEIRQTELQLEAYRHRLEESNQEIESRRKELKYFQEQVAGTDSKLAEANKTFGIFTQQLEEAEQGVQGVREEIFGQFCSRVGVKDIKRFEEMQSRFASEGQEERQKIVIHKQQLERQLSRFRSGLEETEKRLTTLEGSLNRDMTSLKEQEAERESIMENYVKLQDEQKELQEAYETKKNELETRGDTVKEYKDRLQRVFKDGEDSESKFTDIKTELNKLVSRRMNRLRTCNLEGTEVPLIEGSLDNIPVDEVLASTQNPSADPEGDSQMTDAPAHESTNELYNNYGITVDYQDLDDELKSTDDPRVEQELLAKIQDLHAEMEQMSVNSKARERLDKANEQFKEIQGEFDEAKQEAKESREEFNRVKKERTRKFMEAFSMISKEIEVVYRELTQSSTSPLGGSAQLSLENEDEPYLGGVIYQVMPPTKRFCEIENLSGGEKSMAALALLFAMHSYQKAPFFVLDEVDAALDNNNIASVARYINSLSGSRVQFIVISLKNGLFEKSTSLVGIYRNQDENSSNALTLNLGQFSG